MHKVRWALAVLPVWVCAYLVVSAPSAGAHFWRTGSASLGCEGINNSADSLSHGYWYDSGLSPQMRAATTYARSAYIDPTDINTFLVPAVAIDTDVVAYDQDYVGFCGINWHGGSGGTVGNAMCVSLATNPANACEKFEVRYDESYALSASLAERKSLACHENGHTLGLAHRDGGPGCMEFTSGTQLGYTLEERTWINANY